MSKTCARLALSALAGIILLCAAGCGGGLPRIRSEYVLSRAQTIPHSAAPVFSWRATQDVMFTYWGRQSATIRVRAWVPLEPNGEQPAQSVWEVEALTGEGKPLPFIGVERRFRSDSGADLARLTPPLDLNRMPDGLYIIIAPGIEAADGKVIRIRPAAVVCEIRNHVFKPFRFPIPLMPDEPSEMTPPPPPRPPEPEGTAIPG